MDGDPGLRGITVAWLGAGGLLLGLVAVPVSALGRTVGSVRLPWGMVLGLLAVAVCTRAAAWYAGSRRGGVAVAVGWLVASLSFTLLAPGEDVLLPDSTASWVYLLVGVAAAVLAASWPLPRGAAAEAVRARRSRIGLPDLAAEDPAAVVLPPVPSEGEPSA